MITFWSKFPLIATQNQLDFLEMRLCGPADWKIPELMVILTKGWKHQFCLLLVSNDLLWEASQTATRCCNTKTTTLQT